MATPVSKIIDKMKIEYLGSTAKYSADADDIWCQRFISNLDAMVMSFLDFPPSIPQDFRDKQFARHLLWRIGDEHMMFRLQFLRKAKPVDLDVLWVRLFPYITGDFPEEISTAEPKMVRLRLRMYDIVYDLTLSHQSDFDELMEQVVQVIQDVRRMQKA